MKTVVDEALEPFVDGVQLVGTVDVFKDAEEKWRTAQLPINQLGSITIDELLSSGYGTNLAAHVESTAASTGDGAGDCRSMTCGVTRASCFDLLLSLLAYAPFRP